MNIRTSLCLIAALLTSAFSMGGAAADESTPRTTAGLMTHNDPTSLVIAYQAKPEARAAFRDYLKTKGTASFERWKKEGVYSNYQILFQQLTGYNDSTDAFVILTFPNYLATTRWVQIDQQSPGGLSVEGLKLAGVKHSAFAERVAHRRVGNAVPANEVYEISQYQIGEKPQYRKFVAEYPVKMFDNWMAQGNVSEYTVYLALHHAGAPWQAMIVLGYRDAQSYSTSAEMKIKSYAALQSDQAWKAQEASRDGSRKKFIESFYSAVVP